MLSTVYSLLAFIVVIGILVSFHEYGHFLAARLFKIQVLQFSIGFGKALWSRKGKHGTEYRIAMIPLGGYVKMLDEREGPVAREMQAHAFNHQAVWKRCIVILAGPVFNFILAFIAYWLIFVVGFQQVVPVVGTVTPDSLAAKAGFAPNQQIVAINNTPVGSWLDVQTALLDHLAASKPVKVTIKQNNNQENLTIDLSHWQLTGRMPDVFASLGIEPYIPPIPPIVADVTPDSPAAQVGVLAQDKIIAINGKAITDWREMLSSIQDNPGQALTLTLLRQDQTLQKSIIVGTKYQDGKAYGYLGIASQAKPWPAEMLHKVQYSAGKSVIAAWHKTKQMTLLSIELVLKMITGHISWQGISGPIGIAQGAGYSAQLGFTAFISFLALVSISLGVINLVPLAILDGGQFLLCVIEGLIRRPIPEKIHQYALRISVFFLFGVMTLALYNDIMRLQN